jgi:hypothetical protein
MIEGICNYFDTSWTTLFFKETAERIVPFFLSHIILNRITILLYHNKCYDND